MDIYICFYNSVVKDCGSDSGVVLSYLVLAGDFNVATKKDGWLKISAKEISELSKSALSTGQVIRAMRKLEQQGYIESRNCNSMDRRKEYRILMLARMPK